MVKKKKNPTQIIEDNERKNKEYEIAYARARGEAFYPIHREDLLNPSSAIIRQKLLPKTKYTSFHTHPIKETKLGTTKKPRKKVPGYTDRYKSDVDNYFSSLPSIGDIQDLLERRKKKTEIIAQRDIKTGNVGGYFFLMKTKKSPKDFPTWKTRLEFPEDYEGYEAYMKQLNDYKDNPKIKEIGALGENFYDVGYSLVNEPEKRRETINNMFMNIIQKYGLKFRAVPNKGYEYISGVGFLPIENKQGLEHRLSSIIGISGLALSLIFLSPTLTGNAIANLTTKTSSIIGASLFVLGIIGSYFWFRKK